MKSVFAAVAVFLSLQAIAFGQGAGISQNLVAKLGSSDNVDVIVQFKKPPVETDHQAVNKLGGSLKRRLSAIPAAAYSIPGSSIQELANNPEVLSIAPDQRVRMLLDNTAGAVNASAAWNLGLDGSGIGVAVIDSGINSHDDLQGSAGDRVVYHENFSDATGETNFGHGEHVAGILGGNGADSNCPTCTRHLKGIAPNVNLIDLQVLDENGEGSDSAVIAAISRAIELQSQYNIRIINMSLGTPRSCQISG